MELEDRPSGTPDDPRTGPDDRESLRGEAERLRAENQRLRAELDHVRTMHENCWKLLCELDPTYAVTEDDLRDAVPSEPWLSELIAGLRAAGERGA
jgi:hypothetical protein